MNNPFLESFDHLKRDWKALRTQLTAEYTDQQQLAMVAKWWAFAPVTRDWLDWDDPRSWPDPWELMVTKTLDNSAISLGIAYTLILGQDARWTADRVVIHLASDQARTMQHLVVVVDKKYVLNFDYAMISEFDNRLIIQNSYRYDGKRYQEINHNPTG